VAEKDTLHPEKRDKIVGFKMTQTEKDELETYCKKEKVDVSKFVRHCVKKGMVKK